MERTVGFKPTSFGRIHYAEQGAGDALLLLHSNGCSHHEFDTAIDELSASYRCIAWDMPAHGDSEPGTRHLSVEDYTRALIEFMDAMAIERAHVCGASIGGMICMAIGALHPERVESLVIVEAFVRKAADWANDWPVVESMFSIPAQTEAQVAPRFRELTPALLSRWNIDRHKAGSWRMTDVMWAIREFDAHACLARIASPSAVILGSRGPAAASRPAFEALLPESPITMMDDAGHFPMLDDPKAFAAAVQVGISSITGRSPKGA